MKKISSQKNDQKNKSEDRIIDFTKSTLNSLGQR